MTRWFDVKQSGGEYAECPPARLATGELQRSSALNAHISNAARRLIDACKQLHPAYFALVMATGIVAIAAELAGMPRIANGLTAFDVAAFAVLCAMTFIRVALFPARVFRDLIDHTRGVGFFTIVAGTAVLGNNVLIVWQTSQTAEVLWLAAAILWFGLTYAIFTAFTVKEKKPSLADGINGSWLIAVVATQAVADLGVLLAPSFASNREITLLFSLILWLCGGMLYIWMISLIFYRYTFFRLEPSDLMPPYWINMGAMAISTLTGATLIAHSTDTPFLANLVPFLRGFTLLFWSTATWWIPMLVILGFWRHVYKRFRLAYDPLYWGAVFPLGMYTVCTYRLGEVMKPPFFFELARVFVYVALGAWAATFCGLLVSMFHATIGRRIAVRHSSVPSRSAI